MKLLQHVVFMGLFFCLRSEEIESINCKLSEFVNAFNFDFQNLFISDNANMIISPYSIYTALAMLSLGANSTTKKEISYALKWKNGEDHWSWLSIMRAFIEVEDQDVDAKLDVANNAWLAADMNILSKFKNSLEDIFQVSFKTENFKDSQTARGNMNRWVSDHTGNKITDLFDGVQLNEDTRFVLANAIYFKGQWRKPFRVRHTKEGDFTREDGTKTKVQYMFKNSEFLTGIYRNVDVLELPYGSDGKFSMLFAKPKLANETDWYRPQANDFFDITSLSKGINVDLMAAMLESLRESKTDIFVPKFKLERGFNLMDSLPRLGVNDVFSGRADLSKITGERNLLVSSAVHKAFIEVDEEGTAAAGATGFGVSFMSMPPSVVLDRPFLFFILNKRCNTIIFSGKVMDPTF